jgi:hypothetical protein
MLASGLDFACSSGLNPTSKSSQKSAPGIWQAGAAGAAAGTAGAGGTLAAQPKAAAQSVIGMV